MFTRFRFRGIESYQCPGNNRDKDFECQLCVNTMPGKKKKKAKRLSGICQSSVTWPDPPTACFGKVVSEHNQAPCSCAICGCFYTEAVAELRPYTWDYMAQRYCNVCSLGLTEKALLIPWVVREYGALISVWSEVYGTCPRSWSWIWWSQDSNQGILISDSYLLQSPYCAPFVCTFILSNDEFSLGNSKTMWLNVEKDLWCSVTIFATKSCHFFTPYF